jgi:hypothetical protein
VRAAPRQPGFPSRSARIAAAIILAQAIAAGLQLAAQPAEAESPRLGPGFVLESAGSLSSAPPELISGLRSVKGSYSGSGSYNAYLRTDPAFIPLEPGRSYRVSFAYRILATPSRGFEVLFFSPTGGAKGDFLPSVTILGKKGDSGRSTLVNALGPYSDYQARWNIVGRGEIAIDDIEIAEAESGVLVAAEDAEPGKARLAQAFLPEAVAGRGFWTAPALEGGKHPYTWAAPAGALPPGLRLDPDGELYGQPQKAGSYTFLATVRDSAMASTRILLALLVRPAPQPASAPSQLVISDRPGDPWFEAAGSPAAAVVRPAPYDLPFRNPLEGMRPYVGSARNHPFASLARQYIEWNLLEDRESDGVDRIRAVTDRLIGDLPAYNIKVIPRVYLAWPPSRKYWPSDMKPGDYRSPAFRARMLRLISRLGEAWNADPRIAFVEMGILGDWGEQHDPGFPSLGGNDALPADMEKAFGDAFLKAFPDKLLMRRYPRDFAAYPFGLHWDVFGAFDKGFWGNDSSGMAAELAKPGLAARWKTAPFGGEIDPTFLGERDFSENSMRNVVLKYAPRLVDLIQLLHWNHLAVLESLSRSDAELWEKAGMIQKALGYRFVIDEAAYSPRVVAGRSLALALRLRNVGSSPLYYDWPLEVELLDFDTRRPVWKSAWEGLDLRTWLPGAPIEIERSFPLPASLPSGRYILALSILDPAGAVPAARFAVVNYYNGGRTPLGPVGVGASPGTEELSGFDDLQADRSLYYLP